MKKLPTGYPDFRSLIEDGCLYADKTRYICDLIKDGRYYFLSRPRRFGKSLLLSTMKELFLDHRELFKGLWIDSPESDYDFKAYPVIHLDMTMASSSSEKLTKAILFELRDIAQSHEVKVGETDEPNSFLNGLIKAIHKKYGQDLVVLIDEYEAPILSNITDKILAEKNRRALKEFYAPLKSLAGNLRFLFVTGVTKFAQATVFSGDFLEDLTVDNKYANICGFTVERGSANGNSSGADFPGLFQEHLEAVLNYLKTKGKIDHAATSEILKDRVLEWYDGYSWDGETRVINPWSLINFLKKMQFKEFWFTSATPRFLLELIKSRQLSLSMLRDHSIPSMISPMEIGSAAPLSLMFQSGYMTVDSIENIDQEDFLKLKIPNREVRSAFFTNLLALVSDLDNSESLVKIARKIRKALERNDQKAFQIAYLSFLSAIPFRAHAPFEGYYQTVLSLGLAITGLEMKLEESVSMGTMDGFIEIPNGPIYVIEMKYLHKKIKVDKTKASTASADSDLARVAALGRKKGEAFATESPPTMEEEIKTEERLEKAVQEALAQIRDERYGDRFLSSGREIIAIGLAVHYRSDVLAIFEPYQK
jgi:hypothetical protein